LLFFLILYIAGMSPEKICIAGRWTSNCWKIYVTLSPEAWSCHQHYQLVQTLNRHRSEQYFFVDADTEMARQLHRHLGASGIQAQAPQ
jgi:hypothetical protein